jgi:hypothetical protein
VRARLSQPPLQINFEPEPLLQGVALADLAASPQRFLPFVARCLLEPVQAHDRRFTRINANLVQDRHQGCTECLERLG